MPLPSQIYLWDQRTLYIGPLSETLNLSQGAATLLVSLDKPVTFKTPEMEHPQECHSLLLPPGLNISIDTRHAIIANCNLDPMGSDFAAFTEQMSSECNKVKFNLKDVSLFKDKYQSIYENQMDTTDAYDALKTLIEYAVERQQLPHKIDPRILSVVEKIKSNVDDNLSIESLAESINLSVPRLVQLFKIQTGIPVRRYRLWHRLFVTAIYIGKGNSLTDAAVAAGFSDSAHFTNTFRAMLGMTPTSIILQPNSLKFNLPKSS
jgi:AraC-like DNA-binding protein